MSEPVQRTIVVVATGNHMKFKQDIAKAREEMAAAVQSATATLTGRKVYERANGVFLYEEPVLDVSVTAGRKP